MEFRFRAIDEQASTNRPPSSRIGYFAEQALRVGYSGLNSDPSMELLRHPNNVREAILREIEKERIREEIIAKEIAQKRLLEAVVRREIMLEREMALHRVEGFSLFPGSGLGSSSLFEPRMPLLGQPEGRSFEERLTLSIEERLGYRAPRGIGHFPALPVPREPKISEIKPPLEVSKDKVIFLPKPEGNLSGEKRKAVTPPAAVPTEFHGSKKKLKEEWTCEICQVSATSELALKEHFQGKKHKFREAGQRIGKNFTIGLFPKKPSMPIKLVEPTDNPNTEEDKEKPEGESLQANKDLQIIPYTEDSKDKSGDSGKKMWKTGEFKKRFKFWCEMCQVGAFTEKVMNTHKLGKKHVGRLQELNQSGGSVPVPQEGDSEVVADRKEETPENVGEAAEGEAAEDGGGGD